MGLLSRCVASLILIALSSCASVQRKKTALAGTEQAVVAWNLIERGAQDAATLTQYRKGITEVLHDLEHQSSPDRWAPTMKTSNGWTIRINQGAHTHDAWSPKLFDDLIIPTKAHASPISGAVRDGLGLALDGLRVDSTEDRHSKFLYGGRQHLPVTAVLEFSAESSAKKQAILHLYDPREVQECKVGKRKIELARDLVTPVHAVLAQRSFIRRALGGLLRPGHYLDEQGLFVQEPYRADKVPVVFVHGLMSDPHIWENAVLAIWADPVLAKRVQCWCFMYPSGLPVASSAARLRASLASAEQAFDPDGNDPAIKKMMLVGHSMGGLLARMQVIDSGDAFWHTWFSRPPDQVPLDGQIGQMMRSSLLFKANRNVQSVVFIATPHRGSELADGWIGKLGSKLIRTPLQLVQVVTSIATLDVDMLNPARLEMRRMGADSINGLSTKHPVLEAIAERPMKAPCHSIIAIHRDRPTIEETSDGVVPYRSSHLKEAKSEITVKSGHSCTENPATVKAVLEMVRQHLSS